MNDYPKRILAKKHKQPNIVLYFVEFETINHKIRTQWIDLVRLSNYLDLVEQYETRNHKYDYMEIVTDFSEGEYEQLRQLNTLEISIDQIQQNIIAPFTIPQRDNQEFNYQLKSETTQQFELNKELKNITKSFNKGGSRVAFTPDQIIKIITYTKDELDNNKFTFLIQWKPRENVRQVLPSWVGQDKMKLYAPQLLEQYANEKGIKLS